MSIATKRNRIASAPRNRVNVVVLGAPKSCDTHTIKRSVWVLENVLAGAGYYGDWQAKAVRYTKWPRGVYFFIKDCRGPIVLVKVKADLKPKDCWEWELRPPQGIGAYDASLRLLEWNGWKDEGKPVTSKSALAKRVAKRTGGAVPVEEAEAIEQQLDELVEKAEAASEVAAAALAPAAEELPMP